MKKHFQIFIVLVIVTTGYYFYQSNFQVIYTENQSVETLDSLISRKASREMLEVEGEVIILLKDDNEGDRHQKFIIKVNNNTLLIVHNIDLAPRVPVKKGDKVKVYGEYEWNDKGGLIHWTHKDKMNKHPHGWIEYNNKKYH